MKIAMRAEANGMWVCADDAVDGKPAPSRPLQANRGGTEPTGWEKFDLMMQDASGAWVPFECPAAPAPGPAPGPDPGPDPGPPPATGLPIISSKNFVVYGSNPACLDFPATGVFHAFGFMPGFMTIQTTGTEHWPMVDIDGNGPSQSGTLWVLESINGLWHATGAERLRPEQLNGDKPEGSPATAIGEDWLYDPMRWGPMAGVNPRPGEIVGLLVVAGSTRSDDQTPLNARTNPLWVHWPSSAGANPCDRVTDAGLRWAAAGHGAR